MREGGSTHALPGMAEFFLFRAGTHSGPRHIVWMQSWRFFGAIGVAKGFFFAGHCEDDAEER